MKLTTINIQGNIFTSEILEKIRQDDIRYQTPADFGLKPNELVRDEISNAWSLVNTYWQIFKQKRAALSATDSGTSETRKHWILPLLAQLGYEVNIASAEIVNDKSYAISHRAHNKDGFPIHIVGSEQSLDKKAEHGVRLSPHALVQEYINSTDHIYGFVTNGLQFRVLRDATRLSRLSYLEFNLEQMIEEGHYAEFALFYRLLHASRINDKKEDGKDSKLEFYHNEALASGSRIRERLSQAVERSILGLANGLLSQTENQALRDQFDNNQLQAKDYYIHILRSVYRILFLLVIEERNLIYKENLSEEERKLKEIYYNYYSIQRLTYLVNKAIYIDPKKTDLWQSLLTTFRLFEEPKFGKTLGVYALGSGIFDQNAIHILHHTQLNNETLLTVFRYLVTFENENQQMVRVNYADLDVEEFGSVYEGLLEYEPVVENDSFRFKQGDDRSSSGSHYTPEELVKPLITHSLDYIIGDKLKETDPEKALLSITVCDVACGSGHILLAAARRIGFELAKLRTGEDQPTPSVLRVAIRDVIRHCIYGVDLNPLAVELCKVALWLEAHEPGEPLNFLDHRIKNGNAIVGLAHYEELQNGIVSEAFKALPGDDKEIANAFKKRNEMERKTGLSELFNLTEVDQDLTGLQKAFGDFATMPEHTPAQIAAKAKAYEDLTQGKKWYRIKQLADLQVGQFFIPKTSDNKEGLTTHAQYKNYLNNGTQILDRGRSMAVAAEKKFFHWFLEFPEVLQKGGFDCILGNPPYLGGKKISGAYGDYFNSYIKEYYSDSKGSVDLVAYFIRRLCTIVNSFGYLSIITTQSIKEGATRLASLDYLIKNNFKINSAFKNIIWPGEAATIVDIIALTKNVTRNKYINGKEVKFINSFLDDNIYFEGPELLSGINQFAYQGTVVNGDGFILTNESALLYKTKNIENANIIKEYLIGDDLNSNYGIVPSRSILDFGSLSIEEAKKYQELYHIILEKVYPDRQLKKDKTYREKWWQFGRRALAMYDRISELDFYFVTAKTSKHLNFVVCDKKDIILDQSLTVIGSNDYRLFGLLHSSIHLEWARKFSTSQGGTPRYNPTDTFQTFPFPNLDLINKDFLYKVNQIISYREEFCRINNSGLTYFGNRYNDPNEDNILIIRYRDSIRIIDEFVLEAYGWGDIALRHNFYEVDYLPENDRVRYTIHPEARKEVLKRLLELNHKIHAEEVAAGLWDKKTTAKKKEAKPKAAAKSKTKQVEQQPAEQFSMFGEENLKVTDHCKVVIVHQDGREMPYHITPKAIKGELTGKYKQVNPTSALVLAMRDKEENQTFVFANITYTIKEIF